MLVCFFQRTLNNDKSAFITVAQKRAVLIRSVVYTQVGFYIGIYGLQHKNVLALQSSNIKKNNLPFWMVEERTRGDLRIVGFGAVGGRGTLLVGVSSEALMFFSFKDNGKKR